MTDYDCGRIKTGDQDQRYEISFFNPQTKSRQVFGWTDDPVRADTMRNSITKHPTWRDPKVRDRNCSHEVIYAHTRKCRDCGEEVSVGS